MSALRAALARGGTAGILGAVLVVPVVLAGTYASLAGSRTGLVAGWWSVTAVLTALLLVAGPRTRARLCVSAVLVLLSFVTAALLDGRSVVFSVGLGVANTAEAFVVLGWLTGFETRRPVLQRWADYRRWLGVIAGGAAVAAVVTGLTSWADGGAHPVRVGIWVLLTHASAQSVVLPLVLLPGRGRLRTSAGELVAHTGLWVLGASACLRADPTQPVAFAMMPLLVWAAARFPARWAAGELVVVATGLATLTAAGHGPFTPVPLAFSGLQLAASAQYFVFLSAVTSVAFIVAMCHLRQSVRKNREDEVRLSQLLDSASGTAFIATDLSGTITWFSPGAEQLVGFKADDVVGRSTPLLFHETREILARAMELGTTPGYGVVTGAVRDGATQDTRDWTYVRQDRSRLTVSLSVTAVRDAEDRPVSYLSVVRDVTDRRAAELSLRVALDRERETNQRMHDLDRAKGEFVSSVSHELRTPLTSIIGYTEMLGDDVAGNLTDLQKQLVQRIDRNGERLLSLVEDLLTLARTEDGVLELDQTRLDLREPVRAAAEDLVHAAHQGRVTLDLHLPDDEVVVHGDRQHLERLVLNLVSNAVKFTEADGRVEVALERHGRTAEVRVTDTGMGIPLEEQDRLFERFFRSSLAEERAIRGTGLGLNIVRSIAEAHGGRMQVESLPGVGTTFRFRLPLSTPAEAGGGVRLEGPGRAVDVEVPG